jgi:HEPN domain-containing protein
MTATFTMTSADVRAFASTHQPAMLLLSTATEDYAGARCCLINGPLVGLVLAAQAVEKYLKAAILVKDPSRQPRSLSHRLPDIATEVTSLTPALNFGAYEPTIATLAQHYNSRYPDNTNQSRSKGSDEIRPIDDLIVFINENLPFPLEVKLRSGMYSWVCSSRVRSGLALPNEVWIKKDNRALSPLLPRIYSEHDALIASWR